MGVAYSLRFLVVLMRIACGCVDLCDCCFVYVTVVTVVVVLAYVGGFGICGWFVVFWFT